DLLDRIAPAERAAHARVAERLRVRTEHVALLLEEALRPAEGLLEHAVALGPALAPVDRRQGLGAQQAATVVDAAAREGEIRAGDAVRAGGGRGPGELGAAHGDVVVGEDTAPPGARVREDTPRQRVGSHDGSRDPRLGALRSEGGAADHP